MLSETFVASIRAQPKSSNTAVAKDVGIYVQTLQPSYTVTSTFKKSSTLPNCTAVSSTHIFAAQAEKAVVHVYSRERGNQEALISFPERINCLALVHDGLLALGTAEGRMILWEICTGRQVSTPASHLQAMSCIAATAEHLITGSEDSNIHVWSVANLISLAYTGAHEPLRRLSSHRAAVTSLVAGHSSSQLNICLSASKDNTCIIWNYHTAELLRTFLLPSTPLCLALDPCDRAAYIGFKDGSMQPIELYQPSAMTNALFDYNQQATPVQVTPNPLSGAPADIGIANCLGLSFDGTILISGHASGKIIKWDVGPRRFSAELADLNAPVTNLRMLSPFPEELHVKAVNVVKPRTGGRNYSFTGQFTDSLGTSKFEETVKGWGFPSDVLEAAIMEFSKPAASSSDADEQLQKENEELWAVVNEQRALQKRTYEKYVEAKAGR